MCMYVPGLHEHFGGAVEGATVGGEGGCDLLGEELRDLLGCAADKGARVQQSLQLQPHAVPQVL
jgi:hypothetical protein